MEDARSSIGMRRAPPFLSMRTSRSGFAPAFLDEEASAVRKKGGSSPASPESALTMPREQTPWADDRLVALRQEIHRAGADTRRVRNLLTAGGCLTFALILGLVVAAFSWRDPFAPLVVALWLLIGVIPALLIGSAVASGVAARYRDSYRARLRRILSPMTLAERSAVLQPLERVEERDTCAIVAPLLREFGLPSEVTPAAPPDARGDEASPAQTMPRDQSPRP